VWSDLHCRTDWVDSDSCTACTEARVGVRRPVAAAARRGHSPPEPVTARLGARRAPGERQARSVGGTVPSHCQGMKSLRAAAADFLRIFCVRLRGAQVHPIDLLAGNTGPGPSATIPAAEAASTGRLDPRRSVGGGPRRVADRLGGLSALRPLMRCPSAFEQALQRAGPRVSETGRTPAATTVLPLSFPPWRPSAKPETARLRPGASARGRGGRSPSQIFLSLNAQNGRGKPKPVFTSGDRTLPVNWPEHKG
jgi:hypothetical protein